MDVIIDVFLLKSTDVTSLIKYKIEYARYNALTRNKISR